MVKRSGTQKNDIWLAGVDSCPKGWVAVFVHPSGGDTRSRVFNSLKEILDAAERPKIVAIDIPIGLPDRSRVGGRAPEPIVRGLVGPRASSVFRVPSRRAVYASGNKKISFAKASQIARNSSEDGKAFSIQGFHICPKIIQVDELLRGNEGLRRYIYETHPELAFLRLNGNRHLKHSKRTSSGIRLRQRILTSQGFSSETVKSGPPSGASRDDLLDALACAAIARRIHAGLAEPFPKSPPHDAYGLPMAIWA